MSSLWGRVVRATLGPPTGERVRVGTGANGQPGLDIDAQIEMNDRPEPNKARIKLWNVSADTVAKMKEDDAQIRLDVGHYGRRGEGVVRQVFVGDPTPGGVTFNPREGTSSLLEIEARDGGRAYARARLNLSFDTRSTGRQVFDAIAADLGLPLGRVDIDEGFEFADGVVLQGPARRELNDLVRGMDRRWFIRDGALHVVGKDDPTDEGPISFSVEAGNLIGSPKPTDKGIEITALLAPSLRPRRLFRVKSAEFDGFYRCTDLRFDLSSYGGAFYVVARGVPHKG